MSSVLNSRLERGLLGYLVLTYRWLYMILLALYLGMLAFTALLIAIEKEVASSSRSSLLDTTEASRNRWLLNRS
jgi:hypothetical protein